jgi:hypothetical protein
MNSPSNQTTKSRVIRCITKPHAEYITEGEDYYFALNDSQVRYWRVSNNAGSFMSLAQFKRCLQKGWIVFVDNLK